MSVSFYNHPWFALAGSYARLYRLHQPVGIWLLLWPVLISLWTASAGLPKIEYIILFVLGSVASRSAGCAINDFFDSSIDVRVTRTKHRPLAQAELSHKQACLGFTLPMLVCFVIALYLGYEVLVLGFIAAVALFLYPLGKRFVSHPQIILGITYSLGIPMAWVACDRSLADIEWVWLYIANMCWIYAYDTIYAMADKPDDVRIGVHSSAIALGRYDRYGVAVAQLLTLAFLLLWALERQAGYLALSSLLFVVFGFIWQQWYLRKRTIARCITAFRSNHTIQMLLLAAIILDYWLIVTRQ